MIVVADGRTNQQAVRGAVHGDGHGRALRHFFQIQAVVPDHVTENPTGEDQVLRIRARYKDADGNLYSEGSYASFHVTVAPGIAKPRVIKESKPAEKESENGKAAEAEGNKEPAKVEESKETVKPETTEPKKIYEDDRDDPDYVPFD